MRMYDIIKAKRDGAELNREQIDFFIKGLVSGAVPSYQASALLMAIYFNGMTDEETANLTFAIRDSGKKMTVDLGGYRADKHSTGGVGDKTSLVVMPIVASLGIKSVKMSGRGLGHTGGTVDKLEAVKGLRTDLSLAEAESVARRTGLTIIGQTEELAPADKLLYALRDVTATVDSIPLIASSIMGKKLTTDDDVIVLDVKTGSGAFMKSLDESKRLARSCVKIGRAAGKRMSALVTNMDAPLGYAIGNALEVIEAIETLKGRGPSDLVDLSVALAAEIAFLCDLGNKTECEKLCLDALSSGKALSTFRRMVEAQGGDARCIDDTTLFSLSPRSEVRSPRSGFIQKVNAEGYGLTSLMLGAGRSKLGDKIDLGAGIKLCRKVGDYVNKGEVIAVLYGKSGVDEAGKALLGYTTIGDEPPSPVPLILDRIGGKEEV